MRPRPALLAAVLALPVAVFAVEPAPTSPPSGPVPMPYPNGPTTSERDAASGHATGKRIYRPIRARTYYDQSFPLSDGRVLLLNTKNGEVEFGDAAKPGTPPTGKVPPNGTYKNRDGSLLLVHDGLAAVAPTKTPTVVPTSTARPPRDVRTSPKSPG